MGITVLLYVLLGVYLVIGVFTTGMEIWMGRENLSILLVLMALLDGFYPPFTVGFHLTNYRMWKSIQNSNNGI